MEKPGREALICNLSTGGWTQMNPRDSMVSQPTQNDKLQVQLEILCQKKVKMVEKNAQR